MRKKDIRKITKNGQGAYYISIPTVETAKYYDVLEPMDDLIKELKLRERQKVIVKKYGKGILIEDWKK